MKRFITAIFLFIFWMLLSFDGIHTNQAGHIVVWQASDLIMGAVASVLVAFVLAGPVITSPQKIINPMRWLAMLAYIWCLLYYMILSGVTAAYYILHPDVPVKPGVVRVRTRLSSPAARAFLANIINLAPGSLAVDVTDDGVVQVHLIAAEPARMRKDAERLVGRCEDLVERVMG